MDDSHKKYFEDVFYLVEANSFEQFILWEQFGSLDTSWTYKSGSGLINYPKVKWEQINRGHTVQIGIADSRPVVISMFYAMIKDKKVMFYDGISQIVDHKMIEDWLDHMYFKPNLEKGKDRNHCDAQNFAHCLHSL